MTTDTITRLIQAAEQAREAIQHMIDRTTPENKADTEYVWTPIAKDLTAAIEAAKEREAEPIPAFDTSSMDASVWAKAFATRFTVWSPNGVESDTEGLMLGWFANAIMAGFDEAQRREEKREAEPVAIGSEWTPCVKLPIVVHVREQRLGETHVSTREGITPIRPDDLIMRGVSGEEYPIGRELFNKTYTLDTVPQPQVPAGWQLIPVEPFDEALDILKKVRDGELGNCVAYRMLIAAAPKKEGE